MHLAAANTRRSFPPTRGNRPYLVKPRLGRYRTFGNTPQLETTGVTTGVGVGTSFATTAATAATTGALSTALGVAIPVAGAVLGVVLGGLLSGHFAREAGAKNENAALAQIFPLVHQDIVTVINAYNSGQLGASDAVTAINQIGQNYQQAMAKYQTGPGQHNGGCTGSPPPVPGPGVTPTPCNTSCTASCCIYCNVIASWLMQAIAALNAGSGTIQFGSGGASKYGFPAWSYPSLKVQGAKASAAAGSAASSVGASILGNALPTGSTIAGIPAWMLIGGLILAYLVI
jgi:hypothetical protein